MFFSVDTNVIIRAACYCQIPGLGECIGATKRAHLCHDAIQKGLTDVPDKIQRVISTKVIEECGDNMDRIITGNFKEFLSQPGKKEKVARLENKQQNYNIMSTYKNRCLFKLRTLKNQFTKIQNGRMPLFRKILLKIEAAIKSAIIKHDSPKAIEKRLRKYIESLKSTSEEFRRIAIETFRIENERDYAQIHHHQRKSINPADLHILADIYLHLQANRKATCPSCTLLTMDKHLSPFLDSDQHTILSSQISQVYEDQFNIKCIHPWHFLNT